MSANPVELFSTPVSVSKLTDPAFRPERRKRVRTKVHWAVLFFREHAAEAVETVTQDLSSSGFYCLSRAPFACGEVLVCALKVPTHDPLGKEQTLALECKVRVVRSTTAEGGFFGLGCEIQDYRLPTAEPGQVYTGGGKT